jgi:hypothetical protein
VKYTPQRVVELVKSIPYSDDEPLRIFWIRISDGSRENFSKSVQAETTDDNIICLVLRMSLFLNANSVLSDVNSLIDSHREEFLNVPKSGVPRLSILILSRDEFRLPQISSPIVLPDWFPILPRREIHCRISDLSQRSESAFLNCPETRTDEICSALFEIESAIVENISIMHLHNSGQLSPMLAILFPNSEEPTVSIQMRLDGFKSHLSQVQDPNTYRPSSQKSKGLMGQLLRAISRSNSSELSKHASTFANALLDTGEDVLKPSIFSLLSRPSATTPAPTRNWHAIITSIGYSYQLINSSAHAGDYCEYPVNLLYASSLDLRRFLQDSLRHVNNLTTTD